ncbi:hypothetical protein Tco_0295471, partial [Tanacetum coccineum]
VFIQLINTTYPLPLDMAYPLPLDTAYPLPLDTAYRSSETEILCMTRSSINELFTPYKEPEREFRSSRRHFKTLSLDELRSPDFNLLSDQEYSEEEEAEAMVETMEQYMSKTRTDYGSRVARPKIEEIDSFELKGQFLKELRENTFSGSDNEDANEHIEKVLEIVNLFHVSNITFLNKYCPPGRTAKKMEEINNFQQDPDEILYQAWESFKELLKKCPQHYLTKMQERHEENSNLIKEIRATTDAAIRNQGASIKILEIQIGQMSKLIQTKYAVLDLPDMPYPMDRTIDVYKRNITLRVGEEKIIFKSVKAVSSLIRRVYMLSLRERMELDLEARLIGDTLVLNRSLDPFLEDYIELNDLNEPIKLRRNQGDDLMPTIKEGEVIEEFRTRDEDLDIGSVIVTPPKWVAAEYGSESVIS